MCGIAGSFDLTASRNEDDLRSTATAMADALAHRGPDAWGTWVDAARGIAFGHRRLSIVDLSELGRQPMHSATGRYVVTYNGEIYNFPALRRTLESRGHRFRGHSDTEVMLAAFTEWGVEPAIERLNGQFAMAVWDAEGDRLHLVRDRLGEKPLYYGWVGRTLIFGSELKALRAFEGFHGSVDAGALALYFRHKYVPAPWSVYRGIRKLEAGSIVTIERGAGPGSETPRPYWSLREAVEAGTADPFTGSDDDAADALDMLLREAVGMRMIADVPLGAFLSGGVDSSTVVAMMQATSSMPVRTFTIGWRDPAYDEAADAAAVAAHLGTDHTELYVTPEEAMAVIPSLPTIYDEPFADSSQIPVRLVSELARRHVTVSLSGDGGDELFGGYNRYHAGLRTWRRVAWMPAGARRLAGKALGTLSPASWDALYRRVDGRNHRNVGDKMQKLATVIGSATPRELYRALVSHWKDPETLVLGSREHRTVVTDPASWPPLGDVAHTMMFLDALTYLPDDILTKLDRASMSIALEGRVPLLDHRVVEFAWRLPLRMKVRDGRGKWLLRRVLDRYVPRDLIDRPKMGFGIPIGDWLRGPLRDWAESLLSEDRIGRDGLLDPAPVRAKWEEHLAGRRNWQYHLWDVLMLHAWLDQEARTGIAARSGAAR